MNIKNKKMAYNGLINNTDIDIYSGEDALQTEYIEDTQQQEESDLKNFQVIQFGNHFNYQKKEDLNIRAIRFKLTSQLEDANESNYIVDKTPISTFGLEI